MKKTVAIKKNTDFKRLYYKGSSVVSDYVVLYFMENNLGVNRLGITVSKKIGKAVVRNRVRRLIRESYRLMEDRIKTGFDIVLVARMKAADSNYVKVSKAVEYVLNKGSLML